MEITRQQEGENGSLRKRWVTQRMEKSTDRTQARSQNLQLCSEATFLENKTALKYFLSLGYKNSFVSMS